MNCEFVIRPRNGLDCAKKFGCEYACKNKHVPDRKEILEHVKGNQYHPSYRSRLVQVCQDAARETIKNNARKKVKMLLDAGHTDILEKIISSINIGERREVQDILETAGFEGFEGWHGYLWFKAYLHVAEKQEKEVENCMAL